MRFNLDRLLRSNDFALTTEYSHLASLTCDEIVLWKDESGPLRLSRFETNGLSQYRMRLGDEIAVDILPGRQLRVTALPGVPAMTIEHFLADQVLPRLVSHDGGFVLHAGSVRLGADAFLIVGTSGRGKSTLAASFHCNGWPLMGDDSVIVSSSDSPSVSALYASLRLFPDSKEALLPDDVIGEGIAHYSDKQRISVAIVDDSNGASVPIRSIFVLDEPSADISVTQLSIADACMAILGNSFALDPTDTDRARKRLEAASDLARIVSAFRISYPHDYERLPDVRSAILTTLN